MNREMRSLYFSYDSNMDYAQMADRCSDFEFVGNAVLNDYQFVFNSSGMATVIQQPGNNVHGVVWSLSNKDVASLDSYEGVKEVLYRKAMLLVKLANVPPLFMLVYIAQESQPGRPRADFIIDAIADAARQNGLPDQYIQKLLAWHNL